MGSRVDPEGTAAAGLTTQGSGGPSGWVLGAGLASVATQEAAMSLNPLRGIPSVNELLESPTLRRLVDRLSQNVVVTTVRSVLDEVRNEVQHAAADRTLPSVSELAERVARRISETERPWPCPVINATGILLHPELGAAPLAEEAVRAMCAATEDYAGTPADASREALLRQLTGAEAATVVSSGAGAAVLAAAALAGGREVVVSRGQLVEIEEGVHLPEAIVAAGAVVREVGTTNKTLATDYVDAIGDRTGALLLVHSSQFAMVGDVQSATLEQLVEISRRRQVPLVYDLGCGALFDLSPWGLSGEPTVSESVKAGADLVLFRGDRLLGGPPCGIVVGRRGLIEAMNKHPLAGAFRPGRLTMAGLVATLELYRDAEKVRRAVPLLQLITTSADNLKNRAERLAPQMDAAVAIASATVVAETACVGAGRLPCGQLASWCIALTPKQGAIDRLANALRSGTPSVAARIEADRLLLDLRTVFPRQDQDLVAAVEGIAEPSP